MVETLRTMLRGEADIRVCDGSKAWINFGEMRVFHGNTALGHMWAAGSGAGATVLPGRWLTWRRR